MTTKEIFVNTTNIKACQAQIIVKDVPKLDSSEPPRTESINKAPKREETYSNSQTKLCVPFNNTAIH